jgi:predicted nucleotidyltransferase
MTRPYPPSLADLPTLLAPLFEGYPAVRRAYVFGSVADGTAGPGSDLDIALVAERGLTAVAYHRLGYDVYARLSDCLASDRLDVVVLNASESSELRYAAVTDGVVIFDRGDDLEAFERQIRHEYEDHLMTLKRLGIR